MNSIFDNIILVGAKRYYIEDLTERDYFLENTIPYQLTLFGETIEEHAWGSLLCRVVNAMLKVTPKSKTELLSFKCDWSKKVIFSETNLKNYKELECGLFLCCNQTALHSCWLLQALLDLFSVDKSTVKILIHRAPSAEKRDVRETFEHKFKVEFKDYLFENCESKEQVTEIIDFLFEKINPIYAKSYKAYNNMFLFDDYTMAYNYIIKFSKPFLKKLPLKDRAFPEKSFDLLLDFYKVFLKNMANFI